MIPQWTADSGGAPGVHQAVASSPLSVLVDLRPAFDGLYGIAQETRLSFALMQELNGVEVSGLIHHPAHALARGLSATAPKAAGRSVEEIFALSRFVARSAPHTGPLARFRNIGSVLLAFLAVQARRIFGAPIPLHHFVPAGFDHFLWSRLFALTLSPVEFRRCLDAAYATLSPPWQTMHASALLPWLGPYAKVDTSNYDVLVAQSPWPARPHDRTQLVVRFHDAVPVYMPHTMKQPRMGQRFQTSALRSNAPAALFACPSAASRAELLKLYPDAEHRAFVVQDRVSPTYSPSWPAREAVRNTVALRSSGGGDARVAAMQHLNAQASFPYFLMVGTIEPRKNHGGVLAAWEMLRQQMGEPAPALVLVGSQGWQSAPLRDAIAAAERRGPLYHLESVPAQELRDLYSAASAVICASFDEGFDLPAVESLRCGAAIVASDIPVHREMLGDAALFLDPYSVEDIFGVLRRAAGRDVQLELRANASRRADRFDDSTVKAQWELVFDACRDRRRRS